MKSWILKAGWTIRTSTPRHKDHDNLIELIIDEQQFPFQTRRADALGRRIKNDAGVL